MFATRLRGALAGTVLLVGIAPFAYAQTPVTTPPPATPEPVPTVPATEPTAPPPSIDQFSAPAVTPAVAPPPPPTATTRPSRAASPPSLLPRPNEVRGSYKHVLYARYIHDDTARAIVHLFGRRHVGGILWSAFGGYYLISAIAAPAHVNQTTSNGYYTTTTQVDNTPAKLMNGLTGLVFGGIGVGKLTRFSYQRLYEIMNAHDQHQPYPPDILWKLKRKDFR